MPSFITDAVLTEIMEMLREHLWQHQDKIDTLYGDETDNRKATIKFVINMAGKGSQVEIKNTISFETEPGTPPKKVKESTTRLYDPAQRKLPAGDKVTDFRSVK